MRRWQSARTIIYLSVSIGILLNRTAPAIAAGSNAVSFRLIDGRLCARCTLQSASVSILGNAVIDLGLHVPLVLHQRTAELLAVGRGDTLRVSFDEVVLPELPVVSAGLETLETLNREHAAALGEIPAVAVLGLPAFVDCMPQLDIAERVLRLLPASETPSSSDRSDNAGTGVDPSADERVVTLPMEERRGYWMTAVGPEGFPMRVRLSTARHDTYIDATSAALAGAPAGELDELYLGGINIAEYVALRPEDLPGESGARPDVVLGTGLLASFRITVDRINQRVHFERVAPPRFPVAERAYFVARSEEDADAVESFLAENPTSRLASEAGDLLIHLRLAEYPLRQEAVTRALGRKAATVRPERRAQAMVAIADELLASGGAEREALAMVALSLALKDAGEDINARAAYEIHARLGSLALRRENLKEARRHLLAAAFGMPRDPRVNLWLGQLYEQSGKPARAWSRYVQAAISDDPPSEAFVGLDRLNRDPAFRAGFSMAEARQLLEGRVPELHAPDRHGDGAPGTPPSAVRLIELFTCVDAPATMAAELAFGALREYFDGAPVTLVAYHLSKPAPDPLTCAAGESRAAFYGIQHVPTVCFDGVATILAGGDEARAQQMFVDLRAASLSAASALPAAWRISGSAALTDGEVVGNVALTGRPDSEDLRVFVFLCERTVMVAGANALLLHDQVVRAALSPVGGFEVSGVLGHHRFAFRGRLSEISAELERGLAAREDRAGVTFVMRPTHLDPSSCLIAVFLQDIHTKQVLTSGTLELLAEVDGAP